MAELYRLGQSRASVARKLSALRTFVRFLRREGWIDTDPSALAQCAAGASTRCRRISRWTRCRRLLEAPDVSTPLGRRDRAILELFYASGLRLSELVGLDMEDVNLPVANRARGWERAARSASFRSTRARKRRFARGIGPRARSRSAQVAKAQVARREGRPRRDPVFVNARGGAADRAKRAASRRPVRGGLQHALRDQSARAAALVREPSAAARRRPPGDPGTARPRAAVDDAALYAHQCGAAARGLPEGAIPRAQRGRSDDHEITT